MAQFYGYSPPDSRDQSRYHSRNASSGMQTPVSTTDLTTAHLHRPNQAPQQLYANSYDVNGSTTALSIRSDGDASGVLSSTTAIKCEVMIQYLRQRQLEKLWSDGSLNEGVILRRARRDFVCQPPELSGQAYGFYDEISRLNVKVCTHGYFSSRPN